MNLEIKNVSKTLPEYRQVIDLVKNSFPKEEQYPILLLKLWALKKNVHFWAYYQNDEFCGVSYLVSHEEMTFVLYLAVNNQVQSKGYGSAILETLKEKFSGKNITLNIERLDPSADNYEQRVKRLKFYKKNGFYDTDYTITDRGETFLTLTTSPSFSVEVFKKVLRELTLGLDLLKIGKSES
ncbi:GNAT family N-acetyltransferase [Lactococcus lactis]|uniref:GNAT family N-acetyltransferase n=1 Tax=Lactococcus lactis TaxID=1358 RepID=UPI002418876D|nr:GNAT family N-acetyltransferase [Lactococcus lactis]MDG4965210.1 GNAT family N-acetyltransferase [Lactococcus lactis]